MNNNDYGEVKRNLIKKYNLKDIESFMKELGSSFGFIGSEYMIKIGVRNNYIDLLLFNIKYKNI